LPHLTRIEANRLRAEREHDPPAWDRKRSMMSREIDVAVAGGGLAALTAALFAARRGLGTTVFAGGVPGGLLLSIEEIEGVPGFVDALPGYELCPIVQEQAEGAGAKIALTDFEGLQRDDGQWIVHTGAGDLRARSIVLAMGSRLKELGAPGERAFTGRGVSHCATCDGPLMRDKVVAVIGGGDSALQESLTLAKYARKVIVLHRGDALTAQQTYQTRALEHPGIEIRYGVVVEEIVGGDTVNAVRTRDGNVDVDAVFVYVGLEPNTEQLHGCLALSEDGRIPTDSWMRTELPGVAAAGTVRADALYQAATAAADGAVAAIAAARYLSNNTWRNGGSDA
jgi:thioredoxin reductase (NADPH)